MNAEERQIAEINRVKKAIQQTTSKQLKKQYGMYLHRLEIDLHEYRKWQGKAKQNEVI